MCVACMFFQLFVCLCLGDRVLVFVIPFLFVSVWCSVS